MDRAISNPVGCLAGGVSALELTGCWVGSQCQGLKVSGSTQSSHRSPLYWPPSFMMPESRSHPQPQGDPPRPEGRSGSGFCGVSASALSTCVYPPRVESVSLVLGGLLQLSPAGLQSPMLWRLLLPITDPWAGEPGMGLSFHSCGRNYVI